MPHMRMHWRLELVLPVSWQATDAVQLTVSVLGQLCWHMRMYEFHVQRPSL